MLLSVLVGLLLGFAYLLVAAACAGVLDRATEGAVLKRPMTLWMMS